MQGRVIYGLALHCVSTTRSVLILNAADRHRDAAPLVRKVLEFGVMAQWLLHHDREGLEGFGLEPARKAKLLLKSMLASGHDVPPKVVQALSIEVPKLTRRPLSATSSRSA